MKTKICLFFLLIAILFAFSCKKDTPQTSDIQNNRSLKSGLLSFSINGELVPAAIDTTLNTISIIIPYSQNLNSLIANFTLASQVNASVNNAAVKSGFVFNFSNPVVFTITSADKTRSSSFKVIVQTNLQYFGLTGNIISGNSLIRDYEYYFDQFDGSTFQLANCGPAVSTMAIKWADSTFSQTPAQARTIVRPQGGGWSTDDVQAYLNSNGVNNVADTISNLDTLVKKNVDNGNELILCLDMYYVEFNDVYYQHLSKFYTTPAPAWGHFLLVKGYQQSSNNNFYLQVYDPYSQGERYGAIADNQLKGKDRYYYDYDIRLATNNWWPYAIIVFPKGSKTGNLSNLKVKTLGRKVPVATGM